MPGSVSDTEQLHVKNHFIKFFFSLLYIIHSSINNNKILKIFTVLFSLKIYVLLNTIKEIEASGSCKVKKGEMTPHCDCVTCVD